MPIKKEVTIGDCRLILGDCTEILPLLAGVDACVSDPPYGMNWDGKVTTGKNGHGKAGVKAKHYGVKILNDDKPFDPSPLLNFKKVILFGSNHYADKLPKGTTLVWVKRFDGGFGSFLSDAEIAWMKGGHGVYCFRDTSLMGQTFNRNHPTEKPVSLMQWCLEKTEGVIVDPYMGSGTTLVACAKMGRKGIGIELDEDYYNISVERVRKAYEQTDLFVEPLSKPLNAKTSLLPGM